MYIQRILDTAKLATDKSFFLWGPRQTGKSSILKNSLPQATTYNLLHSDTYLRLSQNPSLLRTELTGSPRIIVIDEIQRIPELLNEIHSLIEDVGHKFVLTGSNARKLRRGGVNLLGGRARSKQLHPFVWAELGSYSLNSVFEKGLIPFLYFSNAITDDLSSYTADYIQQEIIAKSAARNIPAFSRFLKVAALCSGQQLNTTKIASDSQVARTTVQEYFEIIKETLIAHELLPWKSGTKRKSVSSVKFYLFDIAITRYLQGRAKIAPATPEFGHFFEQLIFQELKASQSYSWGETLHYWRSDSGLEVDFILDDSIAVEVKSTNNPKSDDLKGLLAISSEGNFSRKILVCMAPKYQYLDSQIHIVPWQVFLEALWKSKKWGAMPVTANDWQEVQQSLARLSFALLQP